MKQSYIPWPLILAGALLSPALGCVDAADSILILQNQRPLADCVVPGDKSAEALSRGRIDIAKVDQSSGYLFTPIVLNRAEVGAVSDRFFIVSGANVDLGFIKDFFSKDELSQLSADGNSRFVQEFSGTITAGGTGTFEFDVIPKSMLEAIAAKLAPGDTTRVLAEIEIIGNVDGGDVSSSVFTYPIDVCNGCLIQDLGACEELDSSTAVEEGGSCQPWQDAKVDCCTSTNPADNSTRSVCPAVSETPPVTE